MFGQALRQPGRALVSLKVGGSSREGGGVRAG